MFYMVSVYRKVIVMIRITNQTHSMYGSTWMLVRNGKTIQRLFVHVDDFRLLPNATQIRMNADRSEDTATETALLPGVIYSKGGGYAWFFFIDTVTFQFIGIYINENCDNSWGILPFYILSQQPCSQLLGKSQYIALLPFCECNSKQTNKKSMIPQMFRWL